MEVPHSAASPTEARPIGGENFNEPTFACSRRPAWVAPRNPERRLRNSLSLLAGNCLWNRWLRGTAIINATEFLFNFHRDLVQPLLGPIRSILMTPDLHLKLLYPIFSPSKLTGEFATRLHGLLITGLGCIGRLANHLQDQVARL